MTMAEAWRQAKALLGEGAFVQAPRPPGREMSGLYIVGVSRSGYCREYGGDSWEEALEVARSVHGGDDGDFSDDPAVDGDRAVAGEPAQEV